MVYLDGCSMGTWKEHAFSAAVGQCSKNIWTWLANDVEFFCILADLLMVLSFVERMLKFPTIIVSISPVSSPGSCFINFAAVLLGIYTFKHCFVFLVNGPSYH